IQLTALSCDQACPFFPGSQQQKNGGTEDEREPATVKELCQVRTEEAQLNETEQAKAQERKCARPSGGDGDDYPCEESRDYHRARNCYAIGGCKCVRGSEFKN